MPQSEVKNVARRFRILLKGADKPEKALPEHLSHFTSLAGLVGILNSSQIFASNVLYLNDKEEMMYGMKLALDVLDQSLEAGEHQSWTKSLRRCARLIRKGRMPNTYAACFCASDDVLSQWRGYSGDEQGISLTFHRQRLQDFFKPFRATLYPIIYGDVDTEQQISNSLRGSLEEAESLMKSSRSEPSDTDRNRKVANLIYRLIPQFKHSGFAEEKEWRFLSQANQVSDNVHFRSSGNMIVPYLKLGTGLDKLPITEITVGPGKDMIATKRSIEIFLKAKMYDDVNVKLSGVPFRV